MSPLEQQIKIAATSWRHVFSRPAAATNSAGSKLACIEARIRDMKAVLE